MPGIFHSLSKATRIADWWYSKIPPLVTVALFLLLSGEGSLAEGGPRLLCVLASIFCVAAYGHVINDLFDIEADARGGKENAMANRSRGQRILACLLPLVGGFLPGLLAPYPAWGWILLGLNYLWPTLYSVPPIRVKERGWGGLVLDAAGSHLTPTLLVLVVLAPPDPDASPLGWWRVAFVAAWSAVHGIKGILYHQIADSKSDAASETRTWARSIDRERLARFLPRYNLLVELPANAALAAAFLPWCPATGILLALYLVVETVKNRLGFEFALNDDPEHHRRVVPFCNDLFYDAWLPLSVALQFAIHSPGAAWVPVLVIVLFARNYLVLVRDLAAVGDQAARRLR